MTSTIDSIDLHVRSYRSALKSTHELTVNSLSNSHLRLEPILHPLANNPFQLDVAAFVYALLRLPTQIDQTQKIIIGQTPDVFTQAGYKQVENWAKVESPARRRTTFFHSQKHLLASFAASISDIDDLTNLLIAYQTEWNKFHTLLKTQYKSYFKFKSDLKIDKLTQTLNISPQDWKSLTTALGSKWPSRLQSIYQSPQNLRIQLLAGSWIDYTKTTQKWWKNVAKTVSPNLHISRQNIYFVSSNTHSLLNIFTGFVLKKQDFIISQIKQDRPQLYQVWQEIQSKQLFLHQNDFLYFAAKYYLDSPKIKKEFLQYQKNLGIIYVPNSHYLDSNVQIFPVKNLVKSKHLDPRLKITHPKKLSQSDALIFNIDYPLGFAAYHILTETLENVARVKGVYITGKAAVLNSEIGDIQIPRLVFDEHTQNTYMFNNCFNNFFPYTNNQGSILTNQKAVSVLGTYLENEALLQKYSENNLTIIEMESGPYLGAVAEATYDQPTPRNTIIDLNPAPMDIGIINYTSDTPYSKAKNLGTQHLTLDGVEPVYLASLAILQRIINLEEQP